MRKSWLRCTSAGRWDAEFGLSFFQSNNSIILNIVLAQARYEGWVHGVVSCRIVFAQLLTATVGGLLLTLDKEGCNNVQHDTDCNENDNYKVGIDKVRLGEAIRVKENLGYLVPVVDHHDIEDCDQPFRVAVEVVQRKKRF